MKRSKIETRSILLRGPAQDSLLAQLVPNLPHDYENPIEILIREQPKKRKKTLNDYMWAGPLADIARQAWHNGRQYSADEWHEGLKAVFLPDPEDLWLPLGQSWQEGFFDPSHVINPETYHKWSINPVTDTRICIGSTTQLTDAGMHVYLRRIEAYASQQFHVEFTTKEEER